MDFSSVDWCAVVKSFGISFLVSFVVSSILIHILDR